MKAAVLYGNEDIRYTDYETPQVTPGSIKVRVMATGICGSDVPRVLYNGAHFYPLVLGHEFAGYVTEVGEGVTSIKVGDHVAGVPLLPCMKCDDCRTGHFSLCKHYSFIGSRQQGSFADYVVLPEQNAVKISKNIPFEQGAMFEPCTVALHGVKLSDYRAGGTVAILGGGTVGLFTMQWAKIFGAKKVVVFGRNKNHLEVAKRLGADAVISTLDEDYMDQVKALTDSKGFDYVYETAGVTHTMYLAFELAANRAHVCFIGTPTKDLTFTPKLWENMNRKEFMLTGSWMSMSAPFPGDEWTLTAHYFSTGEMKFDPDMIYEKFPMRDAAKAFELFKDREKVKGRVMLFNED